jgi:hypothetical protein
MLYFFGTVDVSCGHVDGLHFRAPASTIRSRDEGRAEGLVAQTIASWNRTQTVPYIQASA